MKLIKTLDMTTVQFQNKLVNAQSFLMACANKLTSYNYDDAQDLMQDTIYRALLNEDKFDEGTNLKKWLRTMMKNLFLNNITKADNARIVVDSDTLYVLDEQYEGGFGPTDSCCDLQEITVAVSNLPEDEREVFNMYISGYKYKEIEEALNQPMGTVKSRIHNARKTLQSQLKDFV